MAEVIAKAKMLVRRPASDVFNGFADPDTITRFWLKRTSGPLADGATVEWDFMVPGATETVSVTAFEAPRRIAFSWSGGLNVDMTFTEEPDGATVVAVQASGFSGEDGVDQAVDATEGFSIVLCDLKTLLESGRSANLVKDKAELIVRSMAGA
jgi:uncharacterized protein YndB with AHSA1/START domain